MRPLHTVLPFVFFTTTIFSLYPQSYMKPEHKQTSHTYSSAANPGNRIGYLLYLPNGYDQNDPKIWPVILFLHGAGERGDSIHRVKVHGPPGIVESRDLPFIIVSPQCPAGQWWSPGILNELLDEVTSIYNADTGRIYLTGLSMGGFGTWELAMDFPERFAAIAPICGGGDPSRIDRIKHIPAWIFHGAKDPVVPPERSEIMAEALRKVQGNVKFTLYPEAGHDSWTETYDNKELYEWFLKHQK